MSNKKIKNVGYHISSKDLTGNKFLENSMEKFGIEWAQLFLGNPRSYNIGDPTIKRIKESDLDLNLIIHGPYIINIVNQKHNVYNRSLECIAEALNICNDLNIKYYVTHLGSMPQKTESAKVIDILTDSCHQILEKTDDDLKTELLLETSAGSKSGTRVGTLEEVIGVAANFDSRIGVCLDTEHAYANGLDLTKLNLEETAPEIKVVHLNSIPEDVELNSHRDKHGKIYLKDCKSSVKDSLEQLIKYFFSREVPLILERSGKKIIESDFEYIANLID